MLRALSTVGGFTMISRVTGMVREMLIGRIFGTLMFSDAFYTAFALPNMFRRIFGEGAFNSAFVPLFNRELVEGDKESAERFAINAFSWLGGVLLIGTVIAIPGMPYLARALAPGFSPEALEITTSYGRIMFSYLLCIALGAQLSGVLNSLKVFAVPAFAPVLLNLAIIGALLIVVPLAHLGDRLFETGQLISWAVALAGVLQLALLWCSCWKKGVRIRPVVPRLSPRIRRLLVLMAPGVLAAGVQQVNNIIGRMIASHEVGVVSALSFADRLYQLPSGIIGAAFGVVLLPEISRLLRSKDEANAKQTMGDGLVLSMLLTLPAAVALAVVPGPFVSALYEGGNFGEESVKVVAGATIGFAFGLPAFVLMKVLQAGFFAREDTRTPLLIAVVTVAVNIALSYLLFDSLKALGIAIATSVASWVNVGLLVVGLRGNIGLTRARASKLIRTLLAAGAMGGVVFLLSRWVEPWMGQGFWMNWVVALLIVAGGGAAYAVLALGLRATSVSELKAGFKR